MLTQVMPVILCGGSGTRLWPLSRSSYPKQFLALSQKSNDRSLFQEAVVRLNSMQSSNLVMGETLVVTGEDHRFLVLDQLQDIAAVKPVLLLEPVGKNTAPALTLAALFAIDSDQDPILLITPADQTIQNDDAFARALKNCISVIERDVNKQTIVILGITPSTPETGFGYIKRTGFIGAHHEFTVEKFVEKPDLTTAKQYVNDRDYLWNSGIFVMRASTWLSALKEFRLDILIAAEKAWSVRTQDQAEQISFIRPGVEEFKIIPSQSIDYAVIENCPQSKSFSVKMVELNAGWNDLGAWDAVWQIGEQDEQGNVISGDVLLSNTRNSYIHASSRLVSTAGIDDLIIVETADAVLVAKKNHSQDIKNIVAKLEDDQREEKNLHRKVSRPWGWYDNVDEGERFKVKRICVKPGASLSLQMHHHRAEHWIVVKGVAQITNGDQIVTLTENQSTYIPKGQTHRLSNPGKIPLEIIEVQSGGYLGEDDIVRFEDNYGRN